LSYLAYENKHFIRGILLTGIATTTYGVVSGGFGH